MRARSFFPHYFVRPAIPDHLASTLDSCPGLALYGQHVRAGLGEETWAIAHNALIRIKFSCAQPLARRPNLAF
jgi:hypothetical protein